eukprot:7386298-Prymnesium_polylepis.1
MVTLSDIHCGGLNNCTGVDDLRSWSSQPWRCAAPRNALETTMHTDRRSLRATWAKTRSTRSSGIVRMCQGCFRCEPCAAPPLSDAASTSVPVCARHVENLP